MIYIDSTRIKRVSNTKKIKPKIKTENVSRENPFHTIQYYPCYMYLCILLKLRAENDPVFTEWLKRKNNKYTSPEIKMKF